MFERINTIPRALRVCIGVLLLVVSLFVVILLLATLWTTSTANALQSPAPVTISATNSQAESSHTAPKTGYVSDDPNAVAAGLSEITFRLGQAASSMGYATSSTAISVGTAAAKAVTQAGGFIGHGIQSCATFTARSMVGIGVAVARVPGNIVGSVTSTPGISALIKTANTAPTPVIDPLAISAQAAAALPLLASANQPAVSNNATAVWPIHGAITTLFGVPEPPFQPIHTGLDISDGRAPGVTPIKPFEPGRIIDTITSSSGLGNHVIIDHGGGLTSVYAHLASISVQKGQDVNQSTVLGYEGTTGASTGTHLHFEIRLNGQPKDPHAYIAGQP